MIGAGGRPLVARRGSVCRNVHMKTITVAAAAATSRRFSPSTPRRLPDRETIIGKRSRVPVDSAVYVGEDRGDVIRDGRRFDRRRG